MKTHTGQDLVAGNTERVQYVWSGRMTQLLKYTIQYNTVHAYLTPRWSQDPHTHISRQICLFVVCVCLFVLLLFLFSFFLVEVSSNMPMFPKGGSALTMFACSHTGVDVLDQTCYLTQSHYTDTRPTSPSIDPVQPGF